MVHKVSQHLVRRFLKMPKEAQILRVKKVGFPSLDNKEYNSRFENGGLEQTGQGFEWCLTGRKKTRNLLSVEFKKYTGLFFIAIPKELPKELYDLSY